MTNLNIVKTICIGFFLLTQISIAQQVTANSDEKVLYSPIKIGFKAGFSLGKLSSPETNIYTKNYESVSGFDWGFTFELPFSEHFSIQPEINFTHRGGVRSEIQPITASELSNQLNQFLPFMGKPLVTDENPLYADYRSESNLNYLEIPALAKYGWGNDVRFYVEAGPYVGILLKAQQETSGTSQFYFDSEGTTVVSVPRTSDLADGFVDLPAQSLNAKTDVKDDLHIVNFGAIAGLGVSKKMGEKSELFFDARASYSFNSIQINEVFGKSHVGGIIFSFGYAYTL